jgi:hypothetical protein
VDVHRETVTRSGSAPADQESALTAQHVLPAEAASFLPILSDNQELSLVFVE